MREKNGGKSKDPCKKEKWQCDDEDDEKKDHLWKIYMNLYLENEKRLERDDRLNQRQASSLARLPDLLSGYDNNVVATSSQQPCCFPLDAFNMNERSRLPDRLNPLDKIRIWRNIKAKPSIQLDDEMNTLAVKNTNVESRNMWPCLSRSLHEEQLELESLHKRKLRKLLPCQEVYPQEIDGFDDCKELGHARIPVTCSEKNLLLIDRASGERPGLVNGDYIITELSQPDEHNRVYTGVCLRSVNKGMHLIELLRMRQAGWKFCFYQAIVALLAKTQLRYKYATSGNIDYIYDLAWMLFLHIGSINVKRKIQLDDVVVYNYKYSLEVELVDELELPIGVDENSTWDFFEENLKRIKHAKRRELMRISEQLGWEKIRDENSIMFADSQCAQLIEEFLDNAPKNCKDFILRCCRFCLGFWRDANFWYLYNPYRCDSFGYWDDRGNACIMKFTSRSTLNRHIVILLLRAHAYRAHAIKITWESSEKLSGVIQLFKVIYNCAKVHNVKFLERKPPKGRQVKAIKDEVEEEENETMESMLMLPREQRIWLDKYQINWTKCLANDNNKKVKWHDYHVEEMGKVFSLWGEIHPTERIFSLENRGNQVYACYVIAAGMIRIMAPEYWTPKTLDTIVMCGDRYYTLSRLQSQVTMSKTTSAIPHLLRYFKIGDIFFENDIMKPLAGRLFVKQSHSLWKMLQMFFSKYSFAILNCENCCVGIFKLSGAYFMLDVNSIGPPVFNLGDGAGYLIRVTSFKKFLITLLLTIGSRESSQFHLYPVEILKIIEAEPC